MDVDPAGLRIDRAQLTVGQRAKQRQNTANEPDQHGRAYLPAGLPEHLSRHQKNSGADNRPDRQQSQIAKSKHSSEFGHKESSTVL